MKQAIAKLQSSRQRVQLLVAEEIAPNILKDRLIARLTSHTSSVLELKKVYVSDLMTAFNDKTLHQQLPKNKI